MKTEFRKAADLSELVHNNTGFSFSTALENARTSAYMLRCQVYTCLGVLSSIVSLLLFLSQGLSKTTLLSLFVTGSIFFLFVFPFKSWSDQDFSKTVLFYTLKEVDKSSAKLFSSEYFTPLDLYIAQTWFRKKKLSTPEETTFYKLSENSELTASQLLEVVSRV